MKKSASATLRGKLLGPCHRALLRRAGHHRGLCTPTLPKAQVSTTGVGGWESRCEKERGRGWEKVGKHTLLDQTEKQVSNKYAD